MTAPDDDARTLLEQARSRQAAGDVATSIDLARQALTLEPTNIDALEHLATALVTRRRRFQEGLDLIDRALTLRAVDAGLWYSAGWLYEFAAHESRRRPAADALAPRALYERAAELFRRCLELKPEGKLEGDAQDLLDHVENELLSLG